MAGTADQGLETAGCAIRGRLAFEPARPEDDADIRRLLREHPLAGNVRLSLEREPDARIAAGIEGERHHTVVTRDPRTGRVLALGSRAVRRVWIDGRTARLGYLGQLRRAPSLQGNLRALIAGFSAIEATRRADELPYDLTSIVADNHAARRLLERGLRGIPRYDPIGSLTTLVLSAARGPHRAMRIVRHGSSELLPEIVDCLRRNLRRYQFAPAWTEDDLRSNVRTRDLNPGDFLVLTERGRVTACLALWDQRSFKQIVVRGYAPALRRMRPLLDVGLRLALRPRLPAPGCRLSMAYLSHLAIDGDEPRALVELIRAARTAARTAGIHHLVLGLECRNPMLAPLLRRFPARAYISMLYRVHGANSRGAAAGMDARVPQPEVATL